MTDVYDIKQSNLYKTLNNGRLLKFKKNQVLQSTDYKEAIMMLGSGYVKRYKLNNNGSESIQGIYGPGNIFPITLILKNLLHLNMYAGQEIFYYETVTNCKIYTISQQKFEELAITADDIYKTAAYIAGIRLETYIYNFENVSLQGADKRLAHQLAYHAKKFGKETKNGIEIPIPLKQKDLASLIDVTRETVSVNLKVLKDKKLISDTNKLIIKDLEKLENYAYS